MEKKRYYASSVKKKPILHNFFLTKCVSAFTIFLKMQKCIVTFFYGGLYEV